MRFRLCKKQQRMVQRLKAAVVHAPRMPVLASGAAPMKCFLQESSVMHDVQVSLVYAACIMMQAATTKPALAVDAYAAPGFQDFYIRILTAYS